eukprot:6200527-Pleurochrysis_carterae.AAC.5
MRYVTDSYAWYPGRLRMASQGLLYQTILVIGSKHNLGKPEGMRMDPEYVTRECLQTVTHLLST